MLSSLVITLREGMEIALVLGIILTYLRRTGRATLNRYVYWGLGLAVLVSLVLGIILQIIGFEENEFIEYRNNEKWRSWPKKCPRNKWEQMKGIRR